MIDEPIFIGGMERSGTSLMRAIIGSHPDVALFEWDLPLWTSIFDRFKKKDLTQVSDLAKLLDEIFSHRKVIACDVAVDRSAVEKRISEQQNGHVHVLPRVPVLLAGVREPCRKTAMGSENSTQ